MTRSAGGGVSGMVTSGLVMDGDPTGNRTPALHRQVRRFWRGTNPSTGPRRVRRGERSVATLLARHEPVHGSQARQNRWGSATLPAGADALDEAGHLDGDLGA